MAISHPHLLNSGHWAGKRIGLFGGSFNPPHIGHKHVSALSRHALGLDYIWWLVTPGNPLKDTTELLPLKERMTKCRELIDDPRIIVTDIEEQLRLNRTYDTLSEITKRFSKTSFIWITGMDNALTMHTWHRWKDILSIMPTAHLSRPPAWSLIRQCPLRQLKTQNHVYVTRAIKEPLEPHTTYWILQKKMMNVSSTKIRNST